MNELLKVDFDTQTVSARELYNELSQEDGLKGTERFSKWFERYASYGFVENEDFTSVQKSTEVQNNGGVQIRELQDYELSVEMAKQICMLQKTEKGKKIRQYLIDLEKAWNTPEQIMARALRMADHTIRNLKILIEEQKPKVEFFDAVADSKTAISMNEVAKVIDIRGYGRNKLFEYLRNKKILQQDNVPYQRYVDNGWFRVIEQRYNRNGEPVVTTKTLVYQKGVDNIRKMLQTETDKEFSSDWC